MIKNIRGLSGVVTAVIMIALVMAAGVLVWTFSKNLVDKELDDAKSCYGIFDKVSINNDYTCHDFENKEMLISINVGDVDIEELLISVTGPNSKSFKINYEEKTIEDISNYNSEIIAVSLPLKNGGKTYIITGIYEKPDGIFIAPVANGKQCEVSDSLEEIDDCKLIL